MESAVKDSLLAVICLCGKNFDVKYSAIHENGYEIIFDEEGKYLSECEAAESWDDSPTLRQMKITDEVEGSVNEVIDVLDKLWSCPGLVPVTCLIYAATLSNARGLLPPNVECLRRGL